MSSASEMTGDLCMGLIYNKIGTKASYLVILSLATLGGLGMVYYEYKSNYYGDNSIKEAVWIFPALVLLSKFGASATYNVNYIATFDLFPSVFAVSVLGFGDFIGSFVTIFAPEVAELQSLTPMLVFTALSGIALISTCFLQTKHNHKEQQEI